MEIKDFVFYQAFCQADLLKGYRYLDLAGQVMNGYIDELPDSKVDLNGLEMRRIGPTRGGIAELAVSSQRIWLRYDRPPTLTFVGDQSAKRLLSISSILEVSTYKRLGLRVQLLWPLADVASAGQAFSRKALNWQGIDWQKIGRLENTFVQTQYDAGDGLHVLVRLTTAHRAEAGSALAVADADLPEHVFSVDVDCYENDVSVERTNLGKFFDRCYDVLGESLVSLVSPILEVAK